MLLVKLQCQNISHVLTNDAGESTELLTDEQLNQFLDGKLDTSTLRFEVKSHSCPVMQIETFNYETKSTREESASSDTSAMDKTVEKAEKVVPTNSRRNSRKDRGESITH